MVLKSKLRSYQKEQACFFAKKRRALLFEKTGRGKTLTLLAAFAYLYKEGKLTNMIVAAPLSAYAKKVWDSECKDHTNLKTIDFETLISSASGNIARAKKLMGHYQVVYMKHSHVRKHHEFLTSLIEETDSVVVIDEVHAMKNPNALMTRLWRAATMRTKALWTLTASPLSKNLEDSYNIINFTRPGSLGTFTTFREMYCDTYEEVIGRFPSGELKKALKISGFSNVELFDLKIAPFVIKGTSEIIPEFHQVPYEMTTQEQSIYRKIASGVARTNKAEK